MDKKFDVVGIGSAIVDILGHADDELLKELGLQKGTMTLIPEAEANIFYDMLKDKQEKSGGSVANTTAGIASLGGSTSFIGKCKEDEHGKTFSSSLKSTGAIYNTPLSTGENGTARSFVFITPDAERTMATFLGVAVELSKDDIDFKMVQQAKIVFLEGYLFDSPSAREACFEIMKIAQESNTKIAITLSDPLCVDRHRDDFMDMAMDFADIVLANELEAQALFQVKTLDAAVEEIRRENSRKAQIFAITKGDKGSIIIDETNLYEVSPEKVSNVVDKTGAGDLYASGFLYGLSHGYTTKQSARIGSIAAAEVIGHIGARPEVKLSDLIISGKV